MISLLRKKHIVYLACPKCSADLDLANIIEETNDSVKSGQLKCTKCDREYSITKYIPRFVPINNYSRSFGVEWTKHARTQYDSYSGSNISRKRFFEETKWPQNMEGKIILEVGCGSGRFTEQATSTGAMVVSMDYSFSVDANFASNGEKPNILIVQADIYEMPFKRGYFDNLFCIGVLQHTPKPKEAFMVLPSFLKQGGSITIDVYRKFKGLRRIVETKYWVRPITKRINLEQLYIWCKRYIEMMWPLAKTINKFPRGKNINWMLLIADYIGRYGLSNEMAKEWAILDTFDMLSPRYDNPQTLETVRKWFADAGLADIDVHYGYNGIEGRGVRP